MRGAYGTLRKMLFLSPQMMRQHIDELEYVRELLSKAEEPIIDASWRDSVDSWNSLKELLPKVKAGRAQVLLETLFTQPEVLEALGWGDALYNIAGTPPEQLMLTLKQGLGGTIKANIFEYHRALIKETALIRRILELQQRAFAIAGSGILAAFIALGNFFAYLASRAVFDAYIA